MMDLEVYTNVVILEQVVNLVQQKTIGQLPKTMWETLQLFQFGEGEDAL